MLQCRVDERTRRFAKYVRILYWCISIFPILALLFSIKFTISPFGVVFVSLAPFLFIFGFLQFKFEIAPNEKLTKFWHGPIGKNSGIATMVAAGVLLILGIVNFVVNK